MHHYHTACEGVCGAVRTVRTASGYSVIDCIGCAWTLSVHRTCVTLFHVHLIPNR